MLVLPASVTTLVRTVLWSSPNCEKAPSGWLQSCINTSAGAVVEFHLLVVPMRWNWAVLFNRCWNISQMSWRNDFETPSANPTLG